MSGRERDLPPRAVRAVIDRLVRDGTYVASDSSIHILFPVAAIPAEGEALRGWVIREGATNTIGLGYGISALYICDALLTNGDPTARHVAIDPHQGTRFANCALQFLERASVADLVEHYAEESQIALPRFLSEGRRFDFAFVDGNHRFDAVFVDLFYFTSGGSCNPGPSSSSTTTPFPLSSGPRRSSWQTSGGRSKRCQQSTTATTGRFCAPVASRRLARTTTSSTSETALGRRPVL